MPDFNHTVCIALEHLSAREHLYNLSSLMGFSFVFQGRTHRGAFTGAAPPSPASTAGVLDDVHQGWQDGVRTMASLQHFSSPLIPFFLLQPLRTQSTDTGVCTNNSQICSCSVPRKKYSFLVFVSAHESLHYSEPDKRKQAKTMCESRGKGIYAQSRFDHFLFTLLAKHSIL